MARQTNGTSDTSAASSRLRVVAGHLSGSPVTAKPANVAATSDMVGLQHEREGARHGGELTAAVFLEQGVSCVFTLTGGHIAPILVGCSQIGLRVIDVRDEAAAVFAADASARVTGTVGVAVVTAGPGITNTVTAVKNAQMAESPVVVCAGATGILLKGRGSLQDIDQLALMKPHVKWMATIRRVRDITPTMRRAFSEARSGVPGPVFVEFPLDTLWPLESIREQAGLKQAPPLEMNKVAISKWLEHKYISAHIDRVFKGGFDQKKPESILGSSAIEVNKRTIYHVPSWGIGLIKQPTSTAALDVLHALMKSKRPVFLLGSQAAYALIVDQLRAAISSLGVPVFLSGMSRGLMGVDHALQFRHARGKCLGRADFVLLAGVPADFRVDYGRHINPRAYFVMANRSTNVLIKNADIRKRALALQCDSAQFVVDLARTAGHSPPAVDSWKEWKQELFERDAARDKEIAAMSLDLPTLPSVSSQGDVAEQTFCNPVLLCQEIDRVMEDNSIIIADGGDFVGTAAYILRPRQPLSWIDPGSFGTLGVGGGFAVGVKAHRPDSEVWLLFGDGSCAWSIAELDTCSRHGLPIIAVIGNDACWMQMYRDQIRLLGDAVATTLEHSHYEQVAVGYGAKGILVHRNEDIIPALRQAKQYAREGHSVLINVLIAKSNFRQGSISL